MDDRRLSEAILARVSDISIDTGLIRSDTLKLVNSADEEAFRTLLDQICQDDYGSVFRSNITEHTTGIGQNFIASPEFEDWAGEDSKARTLLCLGDPGVGKTVMATKAIQKLKTKEVPAREAVIYVYCDCTRRRSRLNRRDSSPEARSKGVQTPGHFIASLLRQLVEAHESPTPSLQDLMARHERQKTRPRINELEQAFAEMSTNFDRIYIIVDAMDECDNLEMDTFAAHLLSICSAHILRLLVTSRRHPQIEQIFEDSARLEMSANEDDTVHYLQSRARREFPPRVLRDGQALNRILRALLLSANGIPLIARLHMNALRGVRTPGAMLATIARLQSDSDVYDETYRRAMERITKQPGELPAMAMKVLRWVVCAKRYIYTRELQCVLAIRDDSDSLDEDFIPDMDDVFLACEGLVCLVTGPSNENVRLELVHTTARQYFDKKLAEWAPDVSLDLTRTCLNVLAFDDQSPVPNSLLEYAWRYWGQHAKDVEELEEEEQFRSLTTLVTKILAENDGSASPLSRKVTCDFPGKEEWGVDTLTGYHLAASFGLTRLLEALWKPGDDLDAMFIVDGEMQTPLAYAIASKSIEVIRLMLRLRSINPNARNERGVTQLQAAIAVPEALEALLEDSSANPNEVDEKGRPLVLFAAETGRKRAVELLLSSRQMNPAVQEAFGASLLTLASMNGTEREHFRGLSMMELKERLSDEAVGASSHLRRGKLLATDKKALDAEDETVSDV